MQFSAIHFLSADPSLGRLDTTTMSHQTLMELLVSEFDDKSCFRDGNGDFLDISQWEAVRVDSHGEVTHIEWEQEGGLSFSECGIINSNLLMEGGSMDLRWLPSSLIEFLIPHLNLKGWIDTFQLPRGLQLLVVNNNVFGGHFETSGLPRTLSRIDASCNRLHGSVDLSALPAKCETFHISGNDFSGELDFAGIPQATKRLYLNKNSFTGAIDLLHLPRKVESIMLHDNCFDTPKVLVVRRSLYAFTVDKGNIEEVVSPDGKPEDTEGLTVGAKMIRMDRTHSRCGRYPSLVERLEAMDMR